jgi:hypothetical protein
MVERGKTVAKSGGSEVAKSDLSGGKTKKCTVC